MNYMQKIFAYTLFFILLCLNNISPAYYDTKNNESGLEKNSTFESFNTISETIIALDTTKKKIKKILENSQNTNLSNSNSNNSNSQKKQSKPYLNKKEINEYKVFVNYLSIQINDYCKKIYNRYGSDALLSLPCENEISYSHLDNDNSSLTMNEQIESLDDELINSLGTFDEMLLKEEEIIAMQSRKSQSSFTSSSSMENSGNNNSAGNSSNDKNGQLEEKRSDTSSEKNSDINSENNKELKEKKYSEKEKNSKGGSSANKQSNKKQSKKKQNERRKLDEIDDDIVARQLKEAAEKEKDPALKKKLWDEYYKYKKKNIKS